MHRSYVGAASRGLLVAALAMGSVVVLPRVSAAQGRVVFKPAMEKIVESACNELGNRRKVQAARFTGPGSLGGCEPVQTAAPHGAWRWQVVTVCLLDGAEYSFMSTAGKGIRYQLPSVIENDGNTLTYTFLTQAYDDDDVPFVHALMAKRTDELRKRFDDVKVDTGRVNGAFAIVAKHRYDQKVKDGAVADRIIYFGSEAAFIACDVHEGVARHNREFWKASRGTKLSKLTMRQFELLNPILQEDNYRVQGETNYWRLRYDDYTVGLMNSDSVLTLGVNVAYPVMADTFVGRRADNAVKEFVAKHAFKDFTMTHYWDTKAQTVWILASKPYSALTGRDVMDRVKDFYEGYAKDNGKDLKKTVERAAK